jgi:hypothetical protein
MATPSILDAVREMAFGYGQHMPDEMLAAYTRALGQYGPTIAAAGIRRATRECTLRMPTAWQIAAYCRAAQRDLAATVVAVAEPEPEAQPMTRAQALAAIAKLKRTLGAS